MKVNVTIKSLIISFSKIFVLCILFTDCIENKKDLNKLEHEIFNDIFIELLNRTVEDIRKTPPPPPPPKNDSSEEIEKMKQAFKDAKIAHYKYLNTTKFAPLKIYVSDSINSIPDAPFKDLSKIKKEKFYKNSQNSTQESFKIDLNKINVDSDNYILKYESSMGESLKILRSRELNNPKHLHKEGGIISLSKIRFNKDLSEGVFFTSYYCGAHCGCHFTVFIKKENDEWKINSISNNGCG